ncbi:hypothetical protein KKA17_07045 [bacterium]|nr:hypothetical protein [bacterium]MBU1883482.1 hypothetical protein [bacterium]
MITKFEESNLWKIFERSSDIGEQGIIKNILNKSRPLLKQIVRSFPTFTNHDEEHSLKIIENIEMLLGNDINKLSTTEACVLLLSSYWHDLGMICNDSNEITNEVWFRDYCQNKPECDENNLTNNIVSEYIRINHHKRLEKYLFNEDYILEKEQKSIIIDGNDIVNISYQISMSHNYETKDIQTLKDLSSNANVDDFVFCAILLRLADIMDFDNDRTSISTYKFLALDNPTNEADKYSQKEWKKHIDNVGFEYSNNILYFKANPNDPNVEYDIRRFIKIIKYEIEKCDRVFNAYCHKWRDRFKLPSEIDLSGIKPIGYKYGDFKFTFDNNQVLDLLTGNNIYTNPMIFIREILQNSIDASLYKERLDKEKGYSNFKCKPIEISDWYGKDGAYWIRFDDFGIGMDEYVLLNYFTKIGKSFYESRDFNSHLGFKAISRFGIGILSCFMVADRLEISTKKENAEAIRVSIKSLHSFFVTQLESEHRVVKPFPSKNENSHKYRNDIGTSIAIKIDFSKLNRWFNIKEELEKHIFYSPIAIKYNEEKIGTTLDELDSNPWIDMETIVELDDIDNEILKDHFDMKDMTKKFKIKITPVNLSDYSPTQKIKTQMVLIEFITPIKQEKPKQRVHKYCTFEKDIFNETSLQLKATVQYKKGVDTETISLEKYSEFNKFKNFITNQIGHNGIFIGKDFTNEFNNPILNFTRENIFALAHISLSDEYRPSMNISRSSDINFSYQTLSAVNLSLSRFITQTNLAQQTHDCSLIYQRFNTNFTVQEIQDDKFLTEWKKEQIFLLEDHNYTSLVDINELINTSQKVKILNLPSMGHLSVDYIGKGHTREMFVEILSQLFIDGFIDKNGKYNIVKNHTDATIDKNRKYFPIGFFVRYDEELIDKLQLDQGRKVYGLNIEHKFSKWLYENAELLNNKYKGIFEDIKNTFSSWSRHDKNNHKLKSLLRLIQKLEPNIIQDEVIQSIND